LGLIILAPRTLPLTEFALHPLSSTLVVGPHAGDVVGPHAGEPAEREP
jgi:hypothetical protein